MPLNDSDRALLQLFLEGGQDYAQAAALLGVEPSAAADRARSAISSIAPGEQPPPHPVSDWLLGQADPIAEADAISSIRSDSDLRRRTVAIASGLRLVFPAAQIPEIPQADDSRAAAASVPPQQATPAPPPQAPPSISSSTAPPSPTESSAAASGSAGYRSPTRATPSESFSSRVATRVGGLMAALKRNPKAAVLGGAASVLAIAVVLGITLLGGKDDQGTSAGGNGTATLVPLAPVTDQAAGTGQAVVVAASGAAIVQVSVSGLAPTAPDESYVLWLYRNPEQAYPLARDVVGKTGKLTGPAPVPRGLEPAYSTYGCLELTIASRSAIEAGLKKVAKSGAGPAVGTSVLRGEIAPASRDPRSGSASVCDPSARES